MQARIIQRYKSLQEYTYGYPYGRSMDRSIPGSGRMMVGKRSAVVRPDPTLPKFYNTKKNKQKKNKQWQLKR